MEKSALEMRLENAASLYLEAEAWTSALRVYVALTELNADNGNGWFGIGSILWRIAGDRSDMMTQAISALKRAVDLSPNNRNYKRLLFSATQSADRLGIQADAIPAFTGDPRELLIDAGFERAHLIGATQALDWEVRVRIIRAFSDQPDPLLVEVVEHIAAEDPNTNVRGTAVKALAERDGPSVRDGLIEAGIAREAPPEAAEDDEITAVSDADDEAESDDDDDDENRNQKRMVIYPPEE